MVNKSDLISVNNEGVTTKLNKTHFRNELRGPCDRKAQAQLVLRTAQPLRLNHSGVPSIWAHILGPTSFHKNGKIHLPEKMERLPLACIPIALPFTLLPPFNHISLPKPHSNN